MASSRHDAISDDVALPSTTDQVSGTWGQEYRDTVV